jgi:GDP-L-fucose synthase
MKVFVHGGSGFVGTHVTEKLQDSGVEYVSSTLHQGTDFRNYQQTETLFKKHQFDVVINCSAYVGGISYGYDHPGEMYWNNTMMSANLIELSRVYKVKRFINIISNCSYPAHLMKDFREEQWWDGDLHESVLTYGFVRKASWVQLWSYHKQYGMESVNLIMPNMYGPGGHFDEKRSHALGALVKKMVDAKVNHQKKVVVWGTGTPVREWLYVEDAAEIILRSIAAMPSIEPINIGVGKGISVRELAFLIKGIVGYEGELVFDMSKPDGAPYKTMSNKRMIKHFMGWVPPTDLKVGVAKTVSWYTKHMDDYRNEEEK